MQARKAMHSTTNGSTMKDYAEAYFRKNPDAPRDLAAYFRKNPDAQRECTDAETERATCSNYSESVQPLVLCGDDEDPREPSPRAEGADTGDGDAASSFYAMLVRAARYFDDVDRFTDDDVAHLKDAIAERLRQSGVEVGPTFGVYHPVLRTSGEVHFRVATDCSMVNLKVVPDGAFVDLPPAFMFV